MINVEIMGQEEQEQMDTNMLPEEKQNKAEAPVKESWSKGSELLDGQTAHAYITGQLDQMDDSDICAVFMVDIENMQQVSARFGLRKASEIADRAGGIISSMFYGSDIVSRIGRDKYLIFTLWESDRQKLAEKAELLCERLGFKTETDPEFEVSACAGVYMAEGSGFNFENLFGHAAAALYAAKNNGSGSYCILTNAEEVRARDKKAQDRPVNEISLNTVLKYLEDGVSLIEVGPEIKLIYASRGFYEMSGLEPDLWRLPRRLDQIGIHPDYETEYEHFLRNASEKEGIFVHIHRISGNGKKWTWRHVKVTRVPYPSSNYPVMLELSTDISDRIRAEQQLRESNDRLRVAFRQTPHILWEVDIEARTYNTFNIDEQKCSPDTVIEDFPQAFLDKGLVHADSAEGFRSFAEKLLKGKSGGAGNFIMKDPVNDCYGWMYLSYLMSYDREGNPVKATGIQIKLPDISGIGPERFVRRPLPEIVRHHLLIRMKVNLTSDYVDEMWFGGVDQTAWTWGKTYVDIIRSESKRMFSKSDRKKFLERFDRSQLLDDYKKGRFWSSHEYRRVDDSGDIRWIADTVDLVQDPGTHAIYMFACFSDIQHRHDWENRIKEGIFRDPVTDLYDYATAKKMTEYLIDSGDRRTCALSLIRLVGVDTQTTKDTGEKTDFYRFTAVALTLALGTDCVVGQFKPDIIYTFFPNAGTQFDVKRRIEDAFAYVRVSMKEVPGFDRFRFVAGTVTETADEADCDVLLFRAGYLCELWKNSAMDTVVFPSEDEDWAWAGLRKENKDHGVEVQAEELDRPLTREEQKMAFRCVTDMLKAGSIELSLMNALRCIGNYYKAARTYILKLSDDRQTVTMRYEWTEPGRQSIRYMMSGIHIDQIPLLVKCLENRAPIFMESPAVTPEQSGNSRRWHFTVCPLKDKDVITGFLCVENAREHPSDVALLGTLIPYICGEEKRFGSLIDRKDQPGQDALTILPNLSSYMEVIYSLDSDVYSSMGALSVDIPNFSMINSSFGFEYGRKFLLYIAETLMNLFGKAFIFRTWDAEFVVLFPNTIQEVFNGKCERLRSMLQRRYPRQTRIGSVWTDGIFSARNLVREAQALMRSESLKESPADGDEQRECMYSVPLTEFSQQRFIPYFQPKIDMRNGKLIGAEALARGVDKDGNIVQPAQFIDALEKDGSIRDLDLFMLENVLRQLSEWQEKGFPLIKVSINISRITLFNPTILASVLAIQSRYPDIPADKIELEITETAGDMEKATLACIVDNFRECGVKFELDDFGSGYANLSIFSNIKFETIKLDRSLVNDLPGNEISSMMVEKITQICHNFGMNCVAEGVENAQQEETLLKAGCLYGQGFYYAKPLPASEFESRYLVQDIYA